ncbi:TorF family putative porin [Fulvimarina sp. MAC3]|uniref:TorF family putative porin n=1 Tax=Fulvimarina sp. MAC3 TaxID=3148887 RepID=UPI0031FBDCAE
MSKNALSSMRAGAAVLALGTGLVLAENGFAQSIEDSPFDINLTVDAVTDYVSLRGFSQTDREPAIQGVLDASLYDFHAGFFTSNVYFGTPEPHTEFDPYIAYRPTFGNWSFDVTAYYYFYLDNDDLNYPEVFTTASYNFEDIATVGATFAVAPNYFGDDRETGYFYKANLSVPLPKDFTFSGSVGYQDFDRGFFDRHLVWDAGLTYTFEDTFSFDVRYHDTDLNPDIQCTGTFKCGATVVGTLSFTTGLKALSKLAGGN